MNTALDAGQPIQLLVECAALLDRGAFAELRAALGWQWGRLLSEEEQQGRIQEIIDVHGGEALELLLETALQEGDFRRGERVVSAYLGRPSAGNLSEETRLSLEALRLQLGLFANGLVEQVRREAAELGARAEAVGAQRASARFRVIEADALLLGEQAGLFDSSVRWAAHAALEQAAQLYAACDLEDHAWGVQLKATRFFERERGTEWAVSVCDEVAQAALGRSRPLYAGLAQLRKAVFSRKLARFAARADGSVPWQVRLMIRRGIRCLEQAGSVLCKPLEALALLECGGPLEEAALEALREECVRRDYRPGEIETLQRLAVHSKGEARWAGALLRAAVRSGFCWAQVSARVMLIEGTLRRGERLAAEEELAALAQWCTHPTFGALATMTTANGLLLLSKPTEAVRAARKALVVARGRADKTLASQSAQLLASALEANGARRLARRELRRGIRFDREWKLFMQAVAKYQLLSLSLGSEAAAAFREGAVGRAGSLARASFRICEQGMRFEARGRDGERPHPHWLQVKGQLLFFAGDPLGAMKVLSTARAAFEQLGDTQTTAFLDSLVGYICLDVGRQNSDQGLLSHGNWLLEKASKELPAVSGARSREKQASRAAELEASGSTKRERSTKLKVLLQ